MALSQRTNSILLLCLVSSLTVPTYATLDVPSKLTSAAASTCNGLSPPDPLITQRATLDHALFGRNIATCGYVSGNAAYPLTCPGGYDCISTVQDLVGWACCNQIQCVRNYRTCADLGAGLCEGNLDAAVCSSIYTSILSCSDISSPSCFRYALSTALGDLYTRYSWGCGANANTVLVLATTTGTNGGVASPTTTDYFPTGAAATNTDNIFGIASSSTSTSDSSSSGGGSSSGSGSGSGSSNDSGLNTGSLIGIIIAAVGTIGTLVGAYFAWKAVRRRRDRGGRATAQDGGGGYSGLPQQYGAQGVYGARPVYGPARPYGGQMYPNGWR